MAVSSGSLLLSLVASFEGVCSSKHFSLEYWKQIIAFIQGFIQLREVNFFCLPCHKF